MKEIEIETPCGIVKGICEDQINKFLGIRYGTAGRWEYPREVTSWEGVYSALHFGAAPVQKRAFLHEESREKEFLSMIYERGGMRSIQKIVFFEYLGTCGDKELSGVDCNIWRRACVRSDG